MTQSILDWRATVEEAVRRRKQEQLTQRDLAALAGVSPPTVIAFERGDTRLRMDKVFDILLTLGMLAETGPVGGQESFVQAANRRWSELVAPLADDEPARQASGSVVYDYMLQPDPARISLRDLLPILKGAGEGETGWPPFWIPTRERIKPYSQDGVIECWQGIPEPDHAKDPGQTDFWRVSPSGQAYLRRGLDEDALSVLSPGSVFDVALPIWRTAEVLLHAARLASLWPEPQRSIEFRLRYSGLAGRELASWAKPNRRYLPPGTWRARADDVTSSATIAVENIHQDLSGTIAILLQPVYARFNGFVPPEGLIDEELADLGEAGRRRRGRR